MTPAQASIGLSERISLEGRPVAGFYLVGIGQEPTITVQVDFSSDQPVTPQQFFALVGLVQEELVPAETTVSFMPLTESTFRGVFKIPHSLLPPGTMIADAIPVGESADIQGVKFTITSVSILDQEAPPTPPAPPEVRPPAPPVPPPPTLPPTPPALVEEKKGLSTGVIVGIGLGVVTVGGGVIYVATRKKKRRRRAA